MRARSSSLARRTLALLLVATLAAPPGPAAAAAADEARAVHVLNRLGYGPRPGDVDRVLAMGVERWIERQLAPSNVPEAALGKRLAGLKTIGLDTHELMKGYDLPPEARREVQKMRADLGDDPSPAQVQELRRKLREKYGRDMEGSPRLVLEELQAARLLRAVYAERQLDEVLADFWMNHFNVFGARRPNQYLVGEYEREVIRPHAWGRFEDLLLATAKSPAMLFYLDNYLSVDPAAADRVKEQRERMSSRGRGGMGRGGRPPAPVGNRRQGLNENYARELMELHTLGVDGGYTQEDVTELARCLTGWTIAGLREQQPRFAFDARMHDRGDKTVLGQRIRGGGIEEGEQVIRMLARHPSTARFIATKLARRFVADEPPATVVDRVAEAFNRTQGDIRAVVRAIVTSPEFLALATRTAKVKTPYEFVASALRATGAEVDDARAVLKRLEEMGMPLYGSQPPTGYDDTAETWVSTAGLLARLNFALDLASGRLAGVRIDADAVGVDTRAPAAEVRAALERLLVPAGLSDTTRATLDREEDLTPARTAGLLLGSPEFQRR